ncbi:MAG: TraB/GumN family protein [Gammaproteobacteria bacterium]|nr:TraB/GumN family protein [Gammaproteobacteria bacterium]
MSELPAGSQPIEELQVNNTNITILGTAHVSKASADAVRELINSNQFDVIAIELCDSRFNSIVNPNSLADMDLFEVIKTKKASMVAASLALGAYQQRLAEQFDVQPGEEMRVAIDLAEKNDLHLELIDRDVGITLKRLYKNIPWWRKLYVISGLIASVMTNEKVTEEEIEKLKTGDMLENTFAQFATSAYDLFSPLISERDQFMSAKLRQSVQKHEAKNILAVVGAGHLAGIKQELTNGNAEPQLTIDKLTHLPKGSGIGKFIPWIIVALVLTGFAFGFSKSTDLGWSLVLDWVLINGGLSALGAAIAGAHILTVLTAFLAAPLTSLNPTIGAGVVTSAVELYLRKPTIKDFENVRLDTTRLSGWRSNRVARLILVFLLSTLGSVFGTYIAGFQIFDALVN